MKAECSEKALPRGAHRHKYKLQVEGCFVNNRGKLSWDVEEKNMETWEIGTCIGFSRTIIRQI